VLFYFEAKLSQPLLHFAARAPILPEVVEDFSVEFQPVTLERTWKSFKLASLRRAHTMPNENAITRLLYAILCQKNLKDVS